MSDSSKSHSTIPNSEESNASVPAKPAAAAAAVRPSSQHARKSPLSNNSVSVSARINAIPAGRPVGLPRPQKVAAKSVRLQQLNAASQHSLSRADQSDDPSHDDEENEENDVSAPVPTPVPPAIVRHAEGNGPNKSNNMARKSCQTGGPKASKPPAQTARKSTQPTQRKRPVPGAAGAGASFGERVLAMMDATQTQRQRSANATGGRRADQQARQRTVQKQHHNSRASGLGQRSSKSNLVALRNLRRCANQQDFVIPLRSFQRIVREVAQDKTANGHPVRFQPAALHALQV